MSNGKKDYFSKSAVKKRKTAFEKAQFIRNYEPETTLGQRFRNDISTFFKSLPKIPKGLYQLGKESAIESGLLKGDSGQLWGSAEALLPTIPSYFQNLPLFRESQFVKNLESEEAAFREKLQWPNIAEKMLFGTGKPSLWTSLFNNIYQESLVENTGKWLYDPKERWREWWKHPALTSIEDAGNIYPLYALAKAAGFTGKLSTLTRYGKFSKYMPKHALTGEGVRLGKYGELTAIGRTTEPIIKGVAKVKDFAIKAIKPRAQVIEYITKYYDSISQTKAGLASGKMAKLLNAVPDEQLYEVANAIEGWSQIWKPTPDVIVKALSQGGDDLMSLYKYSKATQGAYEAVKFLREASRKQTYSLFKKGYFGQELVAAEKILKANYGTMAKEFGMNIDDMARYANEFGVKPRYFMHISKEYADTIGKTATTGGTRGLSKPKVGPLQERTSMTRGWYETDPRIVIPNAQFRISAAKILDKLFSNIRKKFAKVIDSKNPLQSGYREVDKYAFKQLAYTRDPLLSGAVRYQIPEWIYKELANVVNNPANFERFMRATWDQGTRVWKMSVLALSPRWVFNNFVGNSVLNLLGGVTNPVAYVKALKIMRQASKLAKSKGWPLMRAYKRLGIPRQVLESGLYRGEAGLTIGRVTERGIGGLPRVSKNLSLGDILEGKGLANFQKYTGYSAIRKLANKMYNLNTGVETFFRSAHYLDKVGKGVSVTQAVNSVNEFLFKYSNMSWVEKAVIRRIDPFWAWHKNIIRLAVTYPIKYPMRASLLAIANRLSQDETDYRFIQEWVKSLMPIPGVTMGGDQAYLSTAGMNPFNDIFVDLGMLHPLLKILIERQTGVQLFKGRGFTSPYPTVYGGVEQKTLPSIWRHIATQFPQARTIESMFRPYATYDTGQPMIDKKTGQIKYPKSRALELSKLFGISITPYDLEEMEKKGADTAFKAWKRQQNYEKLLRNLK